MSFPEYLFEYEYGYDKINCYKLSRVFKDQRESFDERIDSASYSLLGKGPGIYLMACSVDSFCLSFEEALELRNNFYQKELDKVTKQKENIEKKLRKKIKNPLAKKGE